MTREEEIKNNMKLLNISYEEATQLYEDDHSDEILPEVQEMETKAKELKRRYEKDTSKTRKPAQRTIVLDAQKIALVQIITERLNAYGVSNLCVVNQQKEVAFSIGEDEYSVTLTKHRKKKKG